MKKLVSIVGVFFLAIILLTGCGKDNENTTKKVDSSEINSSEQNKDIDTSGTGKLSCTRNADAGEGIDVSLRYELQYQDGIVLNLYSEEKITTEDRSTLDEYEEAYKKIAANYKGLDYYNFNLTRTDNSVMNTIDIDYQKVDINKLLDIEGEEDNVIEDGKVKLKTWLTFAEQFGTVCEEVS